MTKTTSFGIPTKSHKNNHSYPTQYNPPFESSCSTRRNIPQAINKTERYNQGSRIVAWI
jgi:hypothetical protein